MNRPIRRIALAFMVLFLALLVNVNYVQVYQAEDLNTASSPVNKRVILDEYARERGPILVGEGREQKQVAYSEETKDPDDELKYVRKYAKTKLYAHLTGYYSYIYGASQLEADQNAFLSGTDDSLFVRRMVDLLTNRKPKGGSVQLTIDPAAQQAAFDALGDKRGSVVAIEPDTGRVLAMLSKPSYNPNPLASHDLDKEQRAWKRLANTDDKRADNRATQHRYPPGSTFKLVTAAAALEHGDYDPDTVIPAPATLDLPLTDHELPNWQGGLCGSSARITLTEALATSCNTAFGGLGLKLGQGKLREQAEKFGFNDDFANLFRDGLSGSSSQFPEDMDEPQTALSSIGQFDVQSTPLQMAMVTAAIANGGDVMRPYVIDRLIGPELDTRATFDPDLYGRAISSGSAADLTQMMVDTVEDGTAEPGSIPNVKVAGKTGTAQTCDACNPYAWFTSFAPADNSEVAVAVVIEKADVARDEISGGQLAAPVAKAVMEAVLDK